MKHLMLTVGVLGVALSASSVASGEDKPTKSATPLSADEAAIYKAVLRQYVSDESGSLNVSAKTYPLDPDSHMNGLKSGECLKGIQLDNLSAVSRSYHQLTPDVLPGKNMKLVAPEKQGKVVRGNDPGKTIQKGVSVDSAVKSAFATALFSMSEVAFDKEHRLQQ